MFAKAVHINYEALLRFGSLISGESDAINLFTLYNPLIHCSDPAAFLAGLGDAVDSDHISRVPHG